LKTVSVRIAPDSTKPMFIITMVTVGSMALGTTCRQRTVFSERPFARAVRAKSSFITPVIELRMMRWYSPTQAMAKVKTGRNMCQRRSTKASMPVRSAPGSDILPVGNHPR